MKRITIYTLLVALLLNSCGDNLNIDNSSTIPEGYVRTKLTVLANPDKLIVSRATEAQEKYYDPDNVWVLLFNASNKLAELPIRAVNSGGELSVELESTSDIRKAYTLANLSAAQITYLATATNFNVGNTAYDSLKSNTVFVTPAIPTSGMVVDDSNRIPMFSLPIDLPTGTASLTELTANMERIAAKIEVRKSTSVTNFTLRGITLANGARQGHLFPQTPIATNRGGIQKYDEVTASGTIYLHENNNGTGTPSNNPTFIVVKGQFNGSSTDTYYRIDLVNSSLPQPHQPIDIQRNTYYTITITGVTSAGYTSYSDAAAAPANNIHYNICAADLNSFDIMDNGQYYLGVSNSEFIVYGIGALSNLAAATITTDAPANVTRRTVSATATAGGTITVNQTILEPNAMAQDVQINIDAAFTTGSITLTIGNLIKTINIIRKPALLPAKYVMKDFKGTEYVLATKVGEIENSIDEWLYFSSNADGTNPTYELQNYNGGIYLTVNPNISVIRNRAFYLARRNEQGRVKVLAYQSAVTNISNGYAGAFWRRRETGERLIRIPNNQNAWTAQVIWKDENWADDDIILSVNNLPTYPAAGSGLLNAEARPVDGNLTTITGTANTGNPYIYFRIGLKSQYTAANGYNVNNTPARYAIVLLSYNNNTLHHQIYIRQGEDPDYMMRPNDPINSGGMKQSSRPSAVRWSPYNLTSPLMGLTGGLGGSLGLNHPLILPGLGVFTQYPSQAGAYFQWSNENPIVGGIRAYHPINALGNFIDLTATLYSSTWDAYLGVHEACPIGYILSNGLTTTFYRPNDGSTSGTIITGGLSALNSEARQSLFLNSPSGLDTDNSNIIGPCFYADGFFDRRAIVTSPTGQANSTVSYNSANVSDTNNKDVAYRGMLLVNPMSGASLFLPSAGYRGASGNAFGQLYQTANYTNYYTSTSNGTAKVSLSVPGVSATAGFASTGGSNCYTVRCIRK